MYKRLELYVGWKCNYKCIFCIEREKIDKYSDRVISESELFSYLFHHRKEGYDHVTFLGGEPTIQPNFLFALKLAKKLGYTVLVTTNAVTLPVEKISERFLPHIDQLLLSVPIIDSELQPIINGVKNIIDFDRVFENIRKYWTGDFLKINTVINGLNYDKLHTISEYLVSHRDIVTEVSFTYPELNNDYYSTEHLREFVWLPYSKIIGFIRDEADYLTNNWISVKIVDMPFCVMGDEYVDLSDDISYQKRKKINNEWIVKEVGEHDFRPRQRYHVIKCRWCRYTDSCWGPSKMYVELYGDSEIHPIE